MFKSVIRACAALCIFAAASAFAGGYYTTPAIPSKVQILYTTYSTTNAIQQTPTAVTVVGNTVYSFPLKDEAASKMVDLLSLARANNRPVSLYVDPAYTMPLALLGGTLVVNYIIVQAVSLE